ncbi:MAG TPA: hypothetical protein DIT05_19085 [Morganella sp. (in: Bacteria)]|nr:hypothetical protein [Morganella sp. (in: enterobacteria)]
MKTKWTSALLLTSALLTGAMFSTSSLAQSAQTENAQTQQVVTQDTDSSRISINTASAEELAQNLSGIGPKKAQSIIEYRTDHGPFTSAEQLMEVKGIGERIFSINSDKIEL